jgi:hypothetical protein
VLPALFDRLVPTYCCRCLLECMCAYNTHTAGSQSIDCMTVGLYALDSVKVSVCGPWERKRMSIMLRSCVACRVKTIISVPRDLHLINARLGRCFFELVPRGYQITRSNPRSYQPHQAHRNATHTSEYELIFRHSHPAALLRKIDYLQDPSPNMT